MQIYTENRFCLPLFYLIVLGVALYLDLSGQGFRHGRLFRSSRRPAAAGSRRAAPSRMPEAFPGFSPDTPSNARLSPQRTHDTSRFRAACSPCRCLRTSPRTAAGRHRHHARGRTYLTVIHIQLRQAAGNHLSFASDTPLTPGRHRAQAHPPAYRGHMQELQRISAKWKARRVQSRLGARARHQNGSLKPTTPQRTERGVIIRRSVAAMLPCECGCLFSHIRASGLFL